MEDAVYIFTPPRVLFASRNDTCVSLLRPLLTSWQKRLVGWEGMTWSIECLDYDPDSWHIVLRFPTEARDIYCNRPYWTEDTFNFLLNASRNFFPSRLNRPEREAHTHLHLVPRLRMSGVIHPRLHTSWRAQLQLNYPTSLMLEQKIR
jgi:hypothetical protein